MLWLEVKCHTWAHTSFMTSPSPGMWDSRQRGNCLFTCWAAVFCEQSLGPSHPPPRQDPESDAARFPRNEFWIMNQTSKTKTAWPTKKSFHLPINCFDIFAARQIVVGSSFLKQMSGSMAFCQHHLTPAPLFSISCYSFNNVKIEIHYSLYLAC